MPPAIDILERRQKEADTKEIISELVFPSPRKSKTGYLQEPKKAWNKIINKAKIENLRIHDLRRTLASWMASENIDTNTIEVKLLVIKVLSLL